MRRYTARPKRRGVSSYEDTPRPKRRCVSSYEDTPRPKRSVYLEDTPEKMYNVVSLKRIVKCIFGYHSNFGQRNGPKRGACKSLPQSRSSTLWLEKCCAARLESARRVSKHVALLRYKFVRPSLRQQGTSMALGCALRRRLHAALLVSEYLERAPTE